MWEPKWRLRPHLKLHPDWNSLFHEISFGEVLCVLCLIGVFCISLVVFFAFHCLRFLRLAACVPYAAAVLLPVLNALLPALVCTWQSAHLGPT